MENFISTEEQDANIGMIACHHGIYLRYIVHMEKEQATDSKVNFEVDFNLSCAKQNKHMEKNRGTGSFLLPKSSRNPLPRTEISDRTKTGVAVRITLYKSGKFSK